MDEFEEKVNSMLVDTFNYILKYENSVMKSAADVRVTINEVHLIETIRRLEEKASIGNIAKNLNVKMPTATVAIKKLIRKGFAIRKCCEKDKRRSVISLSKVGQKVDIAHTLFHKNMVSNISDNFTDSEKEVLKNVLSKLDKFFINKVGM